MIEYKTEQFADILPEFDRLLQDHMAEMNVFVKHGVKLDVDYDRYVRGQQNNFWILVTARDGDKLVGYIVFSISPHIRFKSMTYAMEDLYYVVPEYRRQGIASKLFAEMETRLNERKVDFIIATVKTYMPHEELLEQAGYECFEKMYLKKLKD